MASRREARERRDVGRRRHHDGAVGTFRGWIALLTLALASCAQSTSPSSGIEPGILAGELDELDEASLCAWARERIRPFEEGKPHLCSGFRSDGGAGGPLPTTREVRPVFGWIDDEWVCGELLEDFADEPVASFETCINTLHGFPETLRDEQRRRDEEYRTCMSDCERVGPPCGCIEHGYPDCGDARYSDPSVIEDDAAISMVRSDCFAR